MVSKPDSKRVAVFQPEFLEDLSYWVETERRTAKGVDPGVRSFICSCARATPSARAREDCAKVCTKF